ncbi:DUF11 domain-containing protein [Alteripontixanthobacter maritimus]|nr:DUF11 domain-containing protein [Alteripontixanthobacter maritimus]
MSLVRLFLIVLLSAIVLAAGMLPGSARAQTETVDWATLGAGNLTGIPSPSTATGSDGTTATVTYNAQTVGPGTFTAPYGNYVSYFNGTVGDAPQPLIINFDNSEYDPNDKVTTIVTLSEAVKNLQFSLNDVDRGAFIDAVEISYDTGNGTWQNAALNNAFWQANSSVARTNDTIVNGWTGVAGSGTGSTNGRLAMSFGNTNVKRVRITYFSYVNAAGGNPSGQFAALSDLTYSRPNTDLSLAKTVSNAAPTPGSSVTYRLTLSSAASSSRTPSNVRVTDTLPLGFAFVSASGTGTFNSGTGVWTVPTIAPGTSVSIELTGTVNASAGATITNTAEVTSGTPYDPDSTPGNGATNEDDYASVSFTVAGARVAGTPPNLVCPAGENLFSWQGRSWAAGSTNNNLQLTTLGDVNIAIANDGVFLNNAAFGGQSPALQTGFDGGLGAPGRSLASLVDMTSREGRATFTVTLPGTFAGAQFKIFDVDFGTNQFADLIEIEGRRNGVTVQPTLTNGVANYVIANTAYGDVVAANNTADGNVVATFTAPIDTIIVRYGNHSAAPANPGQQGIALHDIRLCLPTVDLGLTKVSTVLSDPVNGTNNPKALPGARLNYVFSVANPVDLRLDGVVLSDAVPANLKFCFTNPNGAPAVAFTQGSPTSTLGFSYAGPTNTGDTVEFSVNNGATWNAPVTLDADGCDAAITNFRVIPTGTFAANSNFTLNAQFVLK